MMDLPLLLMGRLVMHRWHGREAMLATEAVVVDEQGTTDAITSRRHHQGTGWSRTCSAAAETSVSSHKDTQRRAADWGRVARRGLRWIVNLPYLVAALHAAPHSRRHLSDRDRASALRGLCRYLPLDAHGQGASRHDPQGDGAASASPANGAGRLPAAGNRVDNLSSEKGPPVAPERLWPQIELIVR